MMQFAALFFFRKVDGLSGFGASEATQREQVKGQSVEGKGKEIRFLTDLCRLSS